MVCPRRGCPHSISWLPQTCTVQEEIWGNQALVYVDHGKSEGHEMLNIWEQHFPGETLNLRWASWPRGTKLPKDGAIKMINK